MIRFAWCPYSPRVVVSSLNSVHACLLRFWPQLPQFLYLGRLSTFHICSRIVIVLIFRNPKFFLCLVKRGLFSHLSCSESEINGLPHIFLYDVVSTMKSLAESVFHAVLFLHSIQTVSRVHRALPYFTALVKATGTLSWPTFSPVLWGIILLPSFALDCSFICESILCFAKTDFQPLRGK